MSWTADLSNESTSNESITKVRHFRVHDYQIAAIVVLTPLILGILVAFALSLTELIHGNLNGLIGLAWALITTYLAGRQLLFARASVGADGLATERCKKVPRFVPWSSVHDVFVESHSILERHRGSDTPARFDALCLRLNNGDLIRIPRVHDAQGLLDASLEALEAWRAREPIDVPESLHADSGHDAYREAAIPTPLLVRVAQEPDVDEEVRVRAAKRAASAGGKAALKEVVDVMADREMRKKLRQAMR